MSEIPFGNTENESHKQSDEDAVAVGNRLTVEQWEALTENWEPVNALFARIAQRRTYEDRKALAENLGFGILFGHFGVDADEDREWAELIRNIWNLSDEALQRLNQALDVNGFRRLEDK